MMFDDLILLTLCIFEQQDRIWNMDVLQLAELVKRTRKGDKWVDVLAENVHILDGHALRPLRIEKLPFITQLPMKLAVWAKLREKKVYDSCLRSYDGTPIEFGTTPNLANIQRFTLINIKYFDGQVLEFLKQLQHAQILRDVRLYAMFSRKPKSKDEEVGEKARIVLSFLLPLIDGIHTLYCNKLNFQVMVEQFPDQLRGVRRMFFRGGFEHGMDGMPSWNPLLKWLANIPVGHENEPKLLVVKMYHAWDQELIENIKERFKSARTPCTFCILLEFMDMDDPVDRIDEFNEYNRIGETLNGHHIQHVFLEEDHHLRVDKTFLITRQQLGAELAMRDWLEQISLAGMRFDHNQRIYLDNPSIGYIDLDDNEALPRRSPAPEPTDNDEESECRPSSSEQSQPTTSSSLLDPTIEYSRKEITKFTHSLLDFYF